MVSLTTNLADLPPLTTQLLSNCLTCGDLWLKIIDDDKNDIFYMSNDEVDRHARMSNPGEAILRAWGNRGQTVLSLLSRLQALSKHHGSTMDHAQLILSRKFKAVRWSRPEEVLVSFIDGNTQVRLECKAIGFPSPDFQWYRNDEVVVDAKSPVLDIPRCKCSISYKYKCIVSNEVADGNVFSEFYRRPGKQYKSLIESKTIDISSFIGDDCHCTECRDEKYVHIIEMVGMDNTLPNPVQPIYVASREEEPLVAADKVALIISNCLYQHLPELVTPHCDAETLAMSLQEMKYKTVTLADLTLEEMMFMIKEYRKLLGNGVYAVFYFVGHGFEVNGQCYLLPVEAPADAHHPEHCLSMDWVLSIFRAYNPALNLLLLDVCRKFIPFECIPAFVEFAEPFKLKYRPNRNTVYGYSTSGGVGAYEIKGDVNGVFMKYLKNHVNRPVSVIDMLNNVLRDIAEDKKVCDVQIPELRSTLTSPRSLYDPLVFDGHTISFDHHTIHWRLMHELPNPVYVRFEDLRLTVTIWFDFCGHFTNKVYVFSSVGDLVEDNTEDIDGERQLSQNALNHLAFLTFPGDLYASKEKVVTDDEEGVSLCVLLSNLQRSRGEVRCFVELKHNSDLESVVSTSSVVLGHVLITRIEMLK